MKRLLLLSALAIAGAGLAVGASAAFFSTEPADDEVEPAGLIDSVADLSLDDPATPSPSPTPSPTPAVRASRSAPAPAAAASVPQPTPTDRALRTPTSADRVAGPNDSDDGPSIEERCAEEEDNQRDRDRCERELEREEDEEDEKDDDDD